MPNHMHGARQNITAKAAPDEASEVNLDGLARMARFRLCLEPNRLRDVTLRDGKGGEMLITPMMGGSEHFKTEVFSASDAPFSFSADLNTPLTLTVIKIT